MGLREKGALAKPIHTQGTDTTLGTQAEALDMGNFNINNLANAVDIHDAATLEDVLNAANVVLHYWIQATSTLGLVYSNTPASGTELVTTGVTELTSADTFFKSSVADTTTPLEVLGGAILLTHLQAEVDATQGNRDAALHTKLYYVDADGTSNPVQIGNDSDSTGTLTIDKTSYELHIHVASATTIPTGKRLWLKIFATVTGSGNDPTVEVYNGDTPSHLSIPVAGSILGNFLQLSGGTMSGDIAMGTNKLTDLKVPDTAGDSIRATAKITEALLESATDLKHAAAHAMSSHTDEDTYDINTSGTLTVGGIVTILVDAALTSDHTWTGPTQSVTAGEILTIGEVAYLKSDGKYWLADADAEATAGAKIVMATATIAAEATGIVLLPSPLSFFRDDSTTEWTVTGIGDVMFLSATAGEITATAPAGNADIVRVVGYMETATVLNFDASKAWVEVVDRWG